MFIVNTNEARIVNITAAQEVTYTAINGRKFKILSVFKVDGKYEIMLRDLGSTNIYHIVMQNHMMTRVRGVHQIMMHQDVRRLNYKETEQEFGLRIGAMGLVCKNADFTQTDVIVKAGTALKRVRDGKTEEWVVVFVTADHNLVVTNVKTNHTIFVRNNDKDVMKSFGLTWKN